MSRPPAVHMNEAIVLLAGAAFLTIMVAPDDDRFYWTPLVLGVSLLAAGSVAGRPSGYWAPGSVLAGGALPSSSSAWPSLTSIHRARFRSLSLSGSVCVCPEDRGRDAPPALGSAGRR